MINKGIIDVCPYQGECSVSGCKRNDDGCFVRQLFEERYKAERELYRKEQECERLKENLPNAITRLIGELDQLKKENERLQKKAEQKLEKIKDYVYSNTDFDKDDSIQSKTAGYDILQIISEVENVM